MKKFGIIAGFILIILITCTMLAIHKGKAPMEATTQPTGKFELNSPAFAANGEIPDKYTCKGQNVNPPLTISGAPQNTVSLALVLHDPDAPTGDFLHWTVWNISPDTVSIDENIVPAGATQGTTDFGDTGYGGPCPPSGTHHYEFDLYALNARLDLNAGASRANLEQAMKPHVIAQSKLVGTVSAK